MQFIDTHCHVHDPEFFKPDEAEKILSSSTAAGVGQMIGIGTSLQDSKRAVEFAKSHPNVYWASLGIHPHEASKLSESEIDDHLAGLEKLAPDDVVVAIGECGFDFYYNDRSADLKKQTKLLVGQLEIAKRHNLPVSFHVREAFEDFWPVYDKFKVRGVLHSFTDRPVHLEKALERGLFIGVNGIATFTSHQWQTELFKQLPLEKLLMETDAPFLTPKPIRGTINSPENVIYITKYLAELKGEELAYIARHTTNNARELFKLSG